MCRRPSSTACPERSRRDDRLARTLDALQPHCQTIWHEVAHHALVQAQVEKRIRVSKHDLQVSPVYLHKSLP